MASESAHIDPAKVRQFAHTVQTTVASYRRAIDLLESRLSQLGRSWQDEEYRAFVGEIRTLKQGLNSYIEEAKTAQARLGALATDAEAYQKIQLR